MAGVRWRIDAVLAVLWALGGLVVAGYFLYLALGPGSLGSPLPLVVLAVVALIGFSVVAWRHVRRDRAARAEQRSGPVGGWVGRPGRRRDDVPGDDVTRDGLPGDDGRAGDDGAGVGAVRARSTTEPPQLSDAGKAQLARIVGIADRAGLFAPRTPAPVDLVETVADAGEPVTLDSVLAGLWEAGFWRPGFVPEDHLAALAFHDSHTEQLAETLSDQVEDLARLVGDVLAVRLVAVDLTAEGRALRTRMRLALGPVDGAQEEQTLDYLGAAKYLSTVLHVTVARALRAAAPDPVPPQWPRLGWTWSDQGVWIAALRSTTVEALNAELGRSLLEEWQWVDEQEPMAAGD